MQPAGRFVKASSVAALALSLFRTRRRYDWRGALDGPWLACEKTLRVRKFNLPVHVLKRVPS